MGAKEVTVTDARFKQALRNGVNNVVQNTVPQMINKAVNESKIRTGVVSKFYPWLDKAEVDLDNVNKKVLCKLPHRFVGSLIDFYIPSGDNSYCEKLHEPCIIPKEPLHCIVINIHDEDSEDYLLLSYFLPDEIVGFAPPHQGNMKITTFLPSAENYIEFGGGGLKVVSKTPVDANYGEYEDDITKLEYMTSDDVYDKSEVYTQDEVDGLIENIIPNLAWVVASSSDTAPEKYTLYVNHALHLAELIIVYKPTTAISGTNKLSINVGNYKPLGITIRRTNKTGIDIGVTKTGDVYTYGSIAANTNVQGMIMWHY